MSVFLFVLLPFDQGSLSVRAGPLRPLSSAATDAKQFVVMLYAVSSTDGSAVDLDQTLVVQTQCALYKKGF